uniref:Endonuclease/exonuclease/phosphatase domain-containing protein n=1 Tax=Brassica oleracea var. oleracea TaxID=109376 RepID=A0A0D3DPS8_BRAOL
MSVKLFFWNVWGLNEPAKHGPFISWLNIYRPLFGAILESHVKKPSLNPILSSLCPGWCFTSNHTSDPDGRILLIWRDSLKVQILAQSNQCITCKIVFPNQAPIIYSAIYASNLSADRVDLWAELIQLQSYLDLENCCWVLGGDFNQILWPSEHSNGHLNTPDSLMYQLQDCLLQLGVFDLRFIGPAHTWTNSQPSNPISKKLDPCQPLYCRNFS